MGGCVVGRRSSTSWWRSLIAQFGTGWIDRLLPPVVIGSVVMVIGLGLARVAVVTWR